MRTLKPLNSTTKDIHKKFLVFDVETYGLEPQPKNLAFGVIYGFNFTKIIRTPKDFKNEFKKDFYKNKKIFAHNAEYDLSSIFGNVITELDESAVFNGKFISCNYHKTQFCDSTNLYPASLDKIGELLNLPKGFTPDKFINPKKYTEKQKRIDAKDIDYCIQDCKIVYTALLKLFQKIGGIRITIASSAMYHFRKNYLHETLLYNDLNDEFFSSYYGGRTEAFKIGKVSANCYDINSLYPHIMSTIKFPDFKNLKKEINPSLKRFHYLLKRKEGLAKVKVKHIDSYFGSLPFKREKDNKLLFPVGEFETTINLNELRYAYKNNLIEFISCEYIIFSNSSDTIFKDYVFDLYTERKESDNELNRQILKLLLNSLYGKFGMREKYKTTYYKRIPFATIESLKRQNKFYELKLFSHSRNDCYLVTENTQTKKSFFSIPSIASYITSGARIMLLDGLLKNENNSVVYCDTDSIFLENDTKLNLPLSNELGEWKLENKKIIEVRGLKNYTYIDEKGETKDAIKGVSKKAIEKERFHYEIQKYTKTKEAIRRNIETGKNQKHEKIISNKYDKRTVLKDGNTKPLKI